MKEYGWFIGLTIVIGAIISLTSCGAVGFVDQGPPGAAAQPCVTKIVPTGVEIDCPGSPSVTVSNGQVGPQGIQGVPGLDAQPCSAVQTASGATIACPGSPPVTVTDGTNATPITVIQLCPGTPSYPDTFVEVAVCIDDKLYAVYSANDGFLTYLPPGEYSSDGIGASCNLMVKPNCVVSN